jgi:hypothetical protein
LAANSRLTAAGLETLASELFAELSEAERRLLRSALKGEMAICGPNGDHGDPANDPAHAENWGRDREVRAVLVRWLCVDQEVSKSIDPRGVWPYGAKITGELDFSFAVVPFPLSFYRCFFTADVHMEFVNMPAIYFNGSLTRSIFADRADVKGAITLNSGFTAFGGVRLAASRMGVLNCIGGHFNNPGHQALNANGVEIKGGAFLTQGFSAAGEVNLVGAHIGTLDCTGGSFQNPGGNALSADKAEIKGSVFLRLGFSAAGEVNLLGAHIESNLECYGGTFNNPGGKALNASGARFGAYVMLQESKFAGEIKLVGAEIGANLDCTQGQFSALAFATMSVKQVFIWRGVQSFSTLDLQGASVGALSDDESGWPAKGNLYADGFVYAHIAQGPTDAPSRIRWLERQRRFTAQPYVQLAKFLHDLGDDGGSKLVSYMLERRRREADREQFALAPSRWRSAPSRWLRFAGDALSRAIVGYGIYPGRALWFLCAMVVLGWIVYFQGQRVGAMAPKDQEAYREFHKDKCRPPESYEPFVPFVYALENSVPLVKFGQDDRWQPDPSSQRHEPAHTDRTDLLGRAAAVRDRILDTLFPAWVTSPAALRAFRWSTIALGWLLTTFFVAAVSGVTKRGE